jgi:hypothetical protein
MKELKVGCARPTGGAVGGSESGAAEPPEVTPVKREENTMSTVKVGHKAPDFESPAYQDGRFGQVSLSDYLGKWVVLCFYPGDFTFV